MPLPRRTTRPRRPGTSRRRPTSRTASTSGRSRGCTAPSASRSMPAAKPAFTSPTYDATRPQPCRGLVMTLHGTAASNTVRPISWSMDLNREVIVAKSMQATWGIAAIELGSCVPSGTFRVQYHSIAGKDWFAALEEQTISSMSITYGATAGNIVTISVPGGNGGITVTSLGMSDDNGLITQEIGWSAARNAGDDAISVAFT